jgi:5-methylcytosine-specific restriction endonuclease McrA
MAYTGEQKKEYQRIWLRNRRQEWVNEHGPCVKCGSTHNLEIDHIDPTLKTLDPSRLWSLSLTNPIRIAELEKCQVLCEQCHLEKTKEQFKTKEHGRQMYEKYGCRCDVCKAAKSKHNAKRYMPR